MLQKPHGAVLGLLRDAHEIEMELKFNETSTMKFHYPKKNHGENTLFYEELVGGKRVQVDPYGIFVVTEVNETLDENGETKEIECESLEHELAYKQTFVAEGTYNLWNPADQDNTMLGMIFSELNWKIGTVSTSLIGRYRTFSEIDSKVLDLLLGGIQDKYNCVFDFNSYTRTVNVFDADETVTTMPVLLSRKNLIESGSLKEDTGNIFTKLYVQGADDVSIRNVNPAGDNYIYNLDYYISNGDIPGELAAKWRTWENTVFTKQSYYSSVVALRNAASSRLLTAQAELVELKNELKTLDNTRATFLQMLKTPYSESSTKYLKENGISTDNVEDYFNGRLNDTAAEYSEIEASISKQEDKIQSIEAERDAHTATLVEINTELKLSNYFTADELSILDCYFKEDRFADSTFAVYDVSVEDSGTYTKLSSAALKLTGVKIQDVECDGGHRISSITEGTVSIVGTNRTIQASIVRGTLDHINGEIVCSFYLGAGTDNEVEFPSGNLTYTAKAAYDDDEMFAGMEKQEDTIYSADKSVSHTMCYYTGDATISGTDASVYFTRNVTDYQQYSVEQDLYDYATECLKDIAWPGYEFDIDSGNFIFAEKFEAFKNAIQLGCNVHLDLEDGVYLTPMLIEIHLNFEKPDDFTLVFSNYFQRPDRANGLKDLLGKAAAASATLDMNKYQYGQNANTTSWVKNMLEQGFEAAKAQILSGKDQMVTIDQAGIVVDSPDGIDKIYLNNGMIALWDKRTNTIKMAMGHFLNEASGADFVGVLADVIGGTLIAGQNLIIECPDPNGGVMQFKVDSSGVILNNGRMYMKTSKGAIGFDSKHGLFLGTSTLFDTTDTGYVHPTCVDPDTGELILDSDGFPKNTNVWMGIDGKVYVRGNIYAESGFFKGTVQAKDYLDTSGKSMMTSDGKFDSKFLDLGNIVLDGETGDITLTGNVNLSEASAITWGSNEPSSGISASRCRTIITEQLVASPTIAGGKFYNLDDSGDVGGTWIEIGEGFGDATGYGLALKTAGFITKPIFGVYNGDSDFTSFTAKGYTFLTTEGESEVTRPMGTWNFKYADVTGLDVTATAVFG